MSTPTIAKSTVPASSLPLHVERFVAAVNAFDTNAILATLSADAVVNDVSREFSGPEAVRAFFDHEFVADRVTMRVTRARDHHGDVILDAEIDGLYDKTNLPSPFILTFYFALRATGIVQLIIVHNKPAVVRNTR